MRCDPISEQAISVVVTLLLKPDMSSLAATKMLPNPEQVFWAMPADFQLLADYGIDASDPVNHKAFGTSGRATGWILCF